MKVISGIYKIYFINNPNKVYIGSTKNLRSRYTDHIKKLLENKHENNLLQIDFNLYSILNIRCELLEKCSNPKSMLEKETNYIKQYNANIDGYNQTIITTNRHDRYIEENYKYISSQNIIDIIKNHNIEVNKIGCKYLDENISLSLKFYNKIKLEDLEKILVGMDSFIRNNLKQSSTISILNYKKIPKLLKIKEERIKNNKRICCLFVVADKLITKITKKIIKNVIVFENCNPFFIEATKMSKEDVDKYRVEYVLRRLLHIKLEKDFIIYVPEKYYNSFSNGLSLLKNQCNSL